MKTFFSFVAIVLFLVSPICLLSQNKIQPDKKKKWLFSPDSLKIAQIDSLQRRYDKTQEFQVKLKAAISCILEIDENSALIGTNGNYCWFFYNGTLTKIAEKEGVNDKTIESISFNKRKKKIYIESNQNTFVSLNHKFNRFFRITKNMLNNPIEDSIFRTFRRRNIASRIWKPIHNFSEEVLPYIIEREKEEIVPRKISKDNFQTIKQAIAPGDVVLVRKNGLLSNKFIPDFWTHVAIFIGNLRDLNDSFAGLELLNGQSPSNYIKKHYPKVYKNLLHTKNPVIESVTQKGVSINSLNHVAESDYLALLRTNLDKENLFLSILKALELYKMPYDFGFDISEKHAIICSGLIYKCFIPSQIKDGISIPFQSLLGSPMMYPGDLVKKYEKDVQNGTNELQLVLFLDSKPENKEAYLSDSKEFMVSYKRKGE